MPACQARVGGQGRRVVDSHATAPGTDVAARDAAAGTLISRPFPIERNYISFLIGSGAQLGRTCVNLWVDGQVVLSATGRNKNRMALRTWEVCRWAGRTARIQGVDRQNGSWGNIGLDHILFTDQPRREPGPLAEESDFGTIALALWNASPEDLAPVGLPEPSVSAGISWQDPADRSATATRFFGQKLLGALARKLSLGPGESGEVVFFITWHFPNLRMHRLPPGRHYGTRFASALTVAEHLAQRYGELRELTQPWHDTWYDSTLPYWFLDRTFLNTSILATSTCHRSANGRF